MNRVDLVKTVYRLCGAGYSEDDVLKILDILDKLGVTDSEKIDAKITEQIKAHDELLRRQMLMSEIRKLSVKNIKTK